MVNSILTLRIRYKAKSNEQVVSIQIDKDIATCEEIAMLFAKELTSKYAKYNPKANLTRYEFGQYKLILAKLQR
jgi:hypothetical protein